MQYHDSHRSTGGHTFDCRMERVLGAEVFVVVHSEEQLCQARGDNREDWSLKLCMQNGSNKGVKRSQIKIVHDIVLLSACVHVYVHG